MSKPIVLNSPRYRVVVGDWNDDSTWSELEVQAITRDLQSAEALFGRHKEWGKPADSGIKLTAVAAYYALRRTGQITGTWEDFEASYLEVSEAGEEVARPTDPAPEAG